MIETVVLPRHCDRKNQIRHQHCHFVRLKLVEVPDEGSLLVPKPGIVGYLHRGYYQVRHVLIVLPDFPKLRDTSALALRLGGNQRNSLSDTCTSALLLETAHRQTVMTLHDVGYACPVLLYEFQFAVEAA